MRRGDNTTEELHLYLMREVYHCPPSVFFEQDQEMIDLHIAIINEQQKKQKLDQKRATQKAKLKK